MWMCHNNEWVMSESVDKKKRTWGLETLEMFPILNKHLSTQCTHCSVRSRHINEWHLSPRAVNSFTIILKPCGAAAQGKILCHQLSRLHVYLHSETFMLLNWNYFSYITLKPSRDEPVCSVICLFLSLSFQFQLSKTYIVKAKLKKKRTVYLVYSCLVRLSNIWFP